MCYKNRREHRLNGHKNCRIGISLGIHDMSNIELHSGDTILYDDVPCIVLWNTYYSEWWAMIISSRWYGDNQYDAESYGKGYKLPMDDGAKMSIKSKGRVSL